MKSNNPKVAFCVINYRTPEMTLAIIQNILNLNNFKKFNSKIFVLDNGSGDNSVDFLEQNLPKDESVELFICEKNLGFAGGQDYFKGHIAKYDYVALVNSDCLLKDNWLTEAVESFLNNKNLGAVGGRAYHWDDNNKPFDENNDFYSFQFIDSWDAFAHTCNYGNDVISVDSMSGAALMIDIKKALDVGYFNKKYFLYFEETDLQAKLKRAGYVVEYNPKLMVWHKVGASSNGDGKKFNKIINYYMYRNRFLFGYLNFDEGFVKRITRRYFISTIKLFLRSKDIEWRNIYLKSLLWIALNYPYLYLERRRTLKLGKTYNNLLAQNNKSSDVTIVITCYNYGRFLEECVESVLSQVLKPKKIIIINDGSTDNTISVLKKYESNKTIQIVNQNNLGVVASKNKAMRMVSTKWIIFLDADDKLDVNYIKDTTDLAIANCLDLVYTDSILFGSKNEVVTYRDYSHHDLYHGNYIHNSALIRADVVNYIGGYSDLKGYEDWEMYIRYSKFTRKIIRIEKPLLYYRKHGSTKLSRNEIDIATAQSITRKVHCMHPEYSFIESDSLYRLNGRAFRVLTLIYNRPLTVFRLLRIPIVLTKRLLGYAFNILAEAIGVR
jgi:GT2 family glycosyltransferase